MRRVLAVLLFSAAVFCGSAHGSFAGPPQLNPSPAPKMARSSGASPLVGGNAPILRWLRSEGAALTPLGLTGGLAGWLVQKDGHSQTVYVTPDGKHIVAGILAGIGGSDLTAIQLEALVITHGKRELAAMGAPATLVAPSPVKPKVETTQRTTGPAPIVLHAASGTSLATKNNPGGNAILLPRLTPAALIKQLRKTEHFTVGYPHLPDMIMIADPTCSVCHASWTLLSPLVRSRRIDVTVVLIDALPGSTKLALDLLADPQVGAAWDRGVGSQAGVPIPHDDSGKAAIRARKYLKDNDRFAYMAKVMATPTVFWVGKGSHVYRGTGLSGVAGFLTAVENHAVEPDPGVNKR